MIVSHVDDLVIPGAELYTDLLTLGMKDHFAVSACGGNEEIYLRMRIPVIASDEIGLTGVKLESNDPEEKLSIFGFCLGGINKLAIF